MPTGNYYSCIICTKENSKKHRQNNWWKYLAQKANTRKDKSIDILTETDIYLLAERQKFKCALTGIEFDINSKWWKASLDRIDSSVGYKKDNLRLIAWIVNHTKGELKDMEFIDMCSKVAKHVKS